MLALFFLSLSHSLTCVLTHSDSNIGLFPLANAICIGIFTYGGWDGLNAMYEELKDPTRTLPISITISLLLVTGIYLLVNFAYFTV